MAKKAYSTVAIVLLVCSSFLYTSFRIGGAYQVGIIGKRISFNMNPVNIIYTFYHDRGHHSLLKFIFFVIAGSLIYVSSQYRIKRIPAISLLIGISYIIAIEIENLCFSGLEICLDIGNLFVYVVGMTLGFWTMQFLAEWRKK